jgi:hypothetical protein
MLPLRFLPLPGDHAGSKQSGGRARGNTNSTVEETMDINHSKGKSMFRAKKIPLPGNEKFHMKQEEPLNNGAAEKPSNLKPKRAGQRIFGKKAGC